jgi:hypothetical protein
MMANYISGKQKKIKTFKKRERELIHAIKNEYSNEKLIKAVKKLREAKIQAIRAQSSPANLSVDESSEFKNRLVNKWELYTDDEIIKLYSKQ